MPACWHVIEVPTYPCRFKVIPPSGYREENGSNRYFPTLRKAQDQANILNAMDKERHGR